MELLRAIPLKPLASMLGAYYRYFIPFPTLAF